MAIAVFDDLNAGAFSPAAVVTPVLDVSTAPESGSVPLVITAYITATAPSGHSFGTFTVSWGDGSADTVTTSTALSHTYSSAGPHNVVVSAVYDGLSTFTAVDSIVAGAVLPPTPIGNLAAFDNINLPIDVIALPNPPTAVAATVLTSDSVQVVWSPPSSGVNPTSYIVTASPGAPGGSLTTTGTAVTFTGLTPSTTYTFSVISVTTVGNSGPTVSPAVTTLAVVIIGPPPPGGSNQPLRYAFPQPVLLADGSYLAGKAPRVFRPINFNRTIDQVPEGQ